MRHDFSALKAQLESSPGPDVSLELALWRTLSSNNTRTGEPPPLTRCTERVLQIIEQILPGFVYILWRDAAGRHHASFAADDRDLDTHAWRGHGANPALACAAALLAALAFLPTALNLTIEL